MRIISGNALRSGVVVAGLLASATTMGASRAAADELTGLLQLKGVGSVYAADPAYVSLPANPGATATYSARIVNNGTVGGQYLLHLRQDGSPAAVAVTVGSLNVAKYAFSDPGYYTPPVEPGKTLIVSIRVTPPAGAPQGVHYLEVDLQSPTSGLNRTSIAITNIKPTKGTTGFDVYARNGTQAFVGGSFNGQVASAPSIKPGASATFTVRLQNDGTTPASIGLLMQPTLGQSCSAVFPATAKDGLVDVSSAVLDGSYVTPVLAAGTHRDITVKISFPASDPTCTDQPYEVSSRAGKNGLIAWSSVINASAAA